MKYVHRSIDRRNEMAAFYNDLEQLICTGAERNGQIMQSTPVYWYKVYRISLKADKAELYRNASPPVEKERNHPSITIPSRP